MLRGSWVRHVYRLRGSCVIVNTHVKAEYQLQCIKNLYQSSQLIKSFETVIQELLKDNMIGFSDISENQLTKKDNVYRVWVKVRL